MENSFAKRLEKAEKKYKKKLNDKTRKQWFKCLFQAAYTYCRSMEDKERILQRHKALITPAVLSEVMDHPDLFLQLTSGVVGTLVYYVVQKRYELDDAGWIDMLKKKYDVFFMRVICMNQIKSHHRGMAIQSLSIFAWKFRSIVRKSGLWSKTLYKIYDLLPRFAEKQKAFHFRSDDPHQEGSCAPDIDLYQMYYLLSGVSILFLSDFVTSDNEEEIISILAQSKTMMPPDYFEELCEQYVNEGSARVDKVEFCRIAKELVKKHTRDLQHQFLEVFPEARSVFEFLWKEKRQGGIVRYVQCDQCKKMIPKTQSKRCSACSVGWYCSRACQKAAWPKHKRVCQVINR